MWVEEIIGQTLSFEQVSAKQKKEVETTDMRGDLSRSTKREVLIAVH